MTLLGAVFDGDSVLVTADSYVWRSDAYSFASYQGTGVKFRQLRDTLILFGAYGDQDIGERIAAQLDVSTAWGSWSELLKVTGDMLRRANTAEGVTRDRITAAMVAGYLGAALGVHRIGPYGSTEADEDPAFLGNGRLVAHAGWAMTTDAAPELSPEDRLRLVMRRTTAAVQPLGPPIRYWRVAPSGIEELAPDSEGLEKL